MRLFRLPKNIGDVEVVENMRVDVTKLLAGVEQIEVTDPRSPISDLWIPLASTIRHTKVTSLHLYFWILWAKMNFPIITNGISICP